MVRSQPPVGRRERNKQEKLRRITDAARELFAERGVGQVTTQEIADKADVGTGTLFLYAKNKGELLLLVQNSSYRDALNAGRSAAARIDDPIDAVMAIARPVIECNRKQVDNGSTYLSEIAFGDPEDPHHLEALMLTAATENEIVSVLRRDDGLSEDDAVMAANVISSIMFLGMASPRKRGDDGSTTWSSSSNSEFGSSFVDESRDAQSHSDPP